jgi:ABC-type phosphate transport system substrate-binding protein
VLLDGWGFTLGAPSPGGPNALGFGYDAGADYPTCTVFKTAADGGTKALNYRATGSGSCLDIVGAKSSSDARSYNDGTTDITNVGFCGTDDPPSEDQIGFAEQGQPVHQTEGQLLTIPVAQIADTVVVRLPDGCEVPNAANRNISRDAANLAFEGVSTKWSDVFGTNIKASSGSGLTDGDCQSKQFKRVVRKDSSGTTFVFKRYLNAASHAAGGDAFDWRDPVDGGTLNNVDWPNDSGSTAVVRGASNGNGALLTALDAQNVDGGIGYNDVATSRANGWAWDFTSTYDPSDRKLWLRVQRITDSTFISPGVVNAQVASGSNAGANCLGVQYANQVTSANLGASWINASAVLTSTDYPICALTYQLAWLWGFDTKNSVFKPVQAGATEGEQRAERDYLRYELGIIRPGVGPSKLAPLGYQKLPSDVLATAQAEANKVGWLRSSSDPNPGDPIT